MMRAGIDHVVLWVKDPIGSLEFYEKVVGLEGVRVNEFRDGKAPFLSLRLSGDSIIDLMARDGAPSADKMVGAEGSAGYPVHHVCLAVSREDFDLLYQRVKDNGGIVSAMIPNLFGARGPAPQGFYFSDPDSNVIEARYYET